MAVIYKRALFAILGTIFISVPASFTRGEFLVQGERISERIKLRLRYIETEFFDGSRCRLAGGGNS